MKCLALIAAVFGGDRLAKNTMEQRLDFHEEKPVCGGWLVLTRHHNSGAACSCFRGKRELLIAVSSGVLGCVCALLTFAGREKKGYLKVAYSLILGGGLSNLYDRLSQGYVVDYIRFAKAPKPIRTLIFNLGDLAIFLGSAFALAGELVSSFQKSED